MVVRSGSGRQIANRADLPAFPVHSLRHAGATNTIARGTDDKAVATRLRHSSVRVTLHISVMPSDDDDQAAADSVADASDAI